MPSFEKNRKNSVKKWRKIFVKWFCDLIVTTNGWILVNQNIDIKKKVIFGCLPMGVSVNFVHSIFI